MQTIGVTGDMVLFGIQVYNALMFYRTKYI